MNLKQIAIGTALIAALGACGNVQPKAQLKPAVTYCDPSKIKAPYEQIENYLVEDGALLEIARIKDDFQDKSTVDVLRLLDVNHDYCLPRNEAVIGKIMVHY